MILRCSAKKSDGIESQKPLLPHHQLERQPPKGTTPVDQTVKAAAAAAENKLPPNPPEEKGSESNKKKKNKKKDKKRKESLDSVQSEGSATKKA